MSPIEPFTIAFPDSEIEKLRQKLSLTRYPDELDAASWDLGSPLAEVQRLATYWKDDFDFRQAEDRLGQLPHFVTDIQCDGFENLRIHFIHKRSQVKGATPLLFVHGWPGCFIEATKLLEPLSGGGGDSVPAFDVVVPSLPNFGFSEGTRKRGFAIEQYAETLHKLMLRLGYNEYVTQGGELLAISGRPFADLQKGTGVGISQELWLVCFHGIARQAISIWMLGRDRSTYRTHFLPLSMPSAHTQGEKGMAYSAQSGSMMKGSDTICCSQPGRKQLVMPCLTAPLPSLPGCLRSFMIGLMTIPGLMMRSVHG